MGVVIFLGQWPGKNARARNHPQTEAIAIGSWLTLFLGFVLWPLVAVWAHMKPVEGGASALGLSTEYSNEDYQFAGVAMFPTAIELHPCLVGTAL